MFSIFEMRKVQVFYKIWTKTNPLDCLKKKKQSLPYNLAYQVGKMLASILWRNTALSD